MSQTKQYKPLQVEPIKRSIICNGTEIEIFEVEIFGNDYDQCVQHSTNMWANQKTGEFGKGLGNTEGDDRKVERHGNLGEMAYAKVFGLSVDFTYIQGGDEQDFLFDECSINIKNAMRNYGAGLIRAETDKGWQILLNNDVYLFSFTVGQLPLPQGKGLVAELRS